MNTDDIHEQIFSLHSHDEQAFDKCWAEIYQYQRDHCPVYNRYCNSLGVKNFPYLPIEAFKHAPVTTFPPEEAELVFRSSGTGKGISARHFIKDRRLYERSINEHFKAVFGEGPYTLLACLPHYAQMGDTSSLLYMVDHLIRHEGDVHSGFFLDDYSMLEQAISV